MCMLVMVNHQARPINTFDHTVQGHSGETEKQTESKPWPVNHPCSDRTPQQGGINQHVVACQWGCLTVVVRWLQFEIHHTKQQHLRPHAKQHSIVDHTPLHVHSPLLRCNWWWWYRDACPSCFLCVLLSLILFFMWCAVISLTKSTPHIKCDCALPEQQQWWSTLITTNLMSLVMKDTATNHQSQTNQPCTAIKHTISS